MDITFWWSAKFENKCGSLPLSQFEIFVNTGLRISKCYSYSFYPISAQRGEDIGNYLGLQSVAFLGSRPSLKKNCGTCKFSHERQWEYHKMYNTFKGLIVERNRWKFGPRSPMCCICSLRVLFVSDFFSEFSLGSFSALCKISDINFSKGYCTPLFHLISTKLYGKHGNRGRIRAVTLSGICQKLTILWHFETSVNSYIAPYGAGNFKTLLLCSFTRSHPNLWEHWLP